MCVRTTTVSKVADRACRDGQGAEALWDDWETPPRVPSSPGLHLDGFDGPLDLLLDLAERKRINLQRLSPLALVEQFAAAMERYAAHVPLERRADWLVMAARLVLLRSRLCFPASPQEQKAAEREVRNTHRQLEQLREIRAAAAWLDARPQLGRDVFARPGERVSPRVSSYMDLMEASLAVLLREEALELQQDQGRSTTLTFSPSSLYPMAAVISSIRLQLQTSPAKQRLECFIPPAPRGIANRDLSSRIGLSATLVAALELARVGEVTLSQDQAEPRLAPIFVERQPAFGAGAALASSE